MKINALYPVIIPNWRMPHHRTEKNVLGFAKTTIEIPEVTSSECPVVLRTIRTLRNGAKGFDLEFRHDGKQFYEEIDVDFHLLVYHLEEAPLNRFSFLGENLANLASLYSAEAKRAFPKGFVKSICDIDPEGDDRLRTVEPLIIFSQETLDMLRAEHSHTIERAEMAFHEACSNFLIADGKLMGRSSEPIITINTLTSPGRMLINWSYEEAARSKKADEYLYTNILYGVSEYRMALDAAKAMSKVAGVGLWGDVKLEIIDPSVFSDHLPLRALWSQKVLLARLFDMVADDDFSYAQSSYDENSISDIFADFLSRIPQASGWRAEGFAKTLDRWDHRPVELPSRSTGDSMKF
jgi:hypothetical protein